MLQIGGASLRSPATEQSADAADDLGATLEAVSDHSDITTTLSCTKRGVVRVPTGESSDKSTIEGSETLAVVTAKAIHVLVDGTGTDPDDVRTVPLTAVEDADASGIVRRELAIETTEATYRIRSDDRGSLDDLARFCRRASWSWRRVAPRLETAESAIDTLATELETDNHEAIERAHHRAKLALSKARSGADRLDVAVEAITEEIGRLKHQLDDLSVQWHVECAEELRAEADRKRATAMVPAARSTYERAREHYQEALSTVHNGDLSGANQIKKRLEQTREALYDLEVEPTVQAHEAIERARSAEDLEAERDAWEQAREHYRETLADLTGDNEALIEYQLAWVDARFVHACRSYAKQLETEADESAASGHDQWANQLYMAANDQLRAARSVARERDGIPKAPIDQHHRWLAEKAPRIDQEWSSPDASAD